MKLIYVFFILLLTSCSIFKKDKLPRIDEPTARFVNTKWMLSKINEQTINVNFEKPTYIKIVDDKSFKGYAGCNQIWGICKQMNTAVQFSNIGRTKIRCENMTIENQLISTLQLANAYLISGNKLQMLTNDGKIILQFQAIEEKK
ncbi:MAG: hypothetical protein RJA07_711 [Bacteroidota bacterium]|jgi:heat shock protein HslJ